MTSELLISAGPGEVRAALVEDGRLVDLAIERAGAAGIVGQVFLARVLRVLPGMNAAFLDIGGRDGDGRDAFLSRADAEYADALRSGPARQAGGDADTRISGFVAEGESLIVQIARAGVGGKAPQATTKITLPGHRLVFTPTQNGKAVSRRIVEEAERGRLGDILAGLEGGYIARTAAAGASAEALAGEAAHLRGQWREMRDRAADAKAPAPLGEGSGADPIARVLRDHASDDLNRILIDRREALSAAREYVARYAPAWKDGLEFYSGEAPLFEARDIEEQIEAALDPRAELASGSYLLIEPTQALTAIDVNTGGNVGRGNAARTMFETNLEAAAEIARQVRLRNIAGLVAIDFIRMDRDDHKRQVVDALIAATRPDPLPVRVGRMTTFGLVELTRRRARPPLADLLAIDCRRCDGTGRFRAPLGVALAALRAVLRQARIDPASAPTLVAAPRIIDCLSAEAASARGEAEAELGRPLAMRRQAGMPGDRFDLAVD
ncbi:MAG: Rne/Rng family ribonuclease [Alphaproteobacteria bacterium]